MNEKMVLTALGPLAPLYEDDTVAEIMVDRYDHVYVEREGSLQDTDVTFGSTQALRALVDGLFALNNIQLGPEKPVGKMRLKKGRMLAVVPPAAIDGPHLVIRKFSPRLITIEDLLKWGAITDESLATLQHAIESEVNILVAGGTGSGKTTFTNILTELIPDDQRIVVVEESNELRVRHARKVYLEAETLENVSMTDLLVTAAQMRPDWLLVGELRGGETMHALQLLTTGHTGMMTIHANDVEDALSRMEAMCLMANLGLGLAEIRRSVASAMQLICVMNHIKFADGHKGRRITQMAEVQGLENNRYIINPLFRFNFETEKLESTGNQPSWTA